MAITNLWDLVSHHCQTNYFVSFGYGYRLVINSFLLQQILKVIHFKRFKTRKYCKPLMFLSDLQACEICLTLISIWLVMISVHDQSWGIISQSDLLEKLRSKSSSKSFQNFNKNKDFTLVSTLRWRTSRSTLQRTFPLRWISIPPSPSLPSLWSSSPCGSQLVTPQWPSRKWGFIACSVCQDLCMRAFVWQLF